MVNNQLYQKKHGLPGVTMISGRDGYVGSNGCNVYFGYVGDFFDNIEMTVDNIIRVAKLNRSNNPSEFYTGIFKKSGENYTEQDNYVENEKVGSDGVTITVDQNKNIFRNIYENEYMYDEYDYNQEDHLSNQYIKVDTAGTGRDKTGANNISTRWNLNSNLRHNWLDQLGIRDANNKIPLWDAKIPWPYSAFPPNTDSKWWDIMPGKITSVPMPKELENRKHTTNELFTVNINGRAYAFTTSKSGHYNSEDSIKWTFRDSLKSSSTNPTISEIIEEFERQQGSAAVDYIKNSNLLTEKVVITDRLKTTFNVGDVLYFYTDKNAFNLYHTVEYMVVITPALHNCTLSELIENADITNPFSFKFIDDIPVYNENYLLSQKKVTTVHYDSDEKDKAEDIQKNGEKFAYLTGYSGNSLMNIGLMMKKSSDKTVNIVNLSTLNSDMNISSNKNEFYLKTKNNAVLKVNNPYFRNNNVGNIEMKGMLSPNDIIIDSRGVTYTLTEDDYGYKTKQFSINPDNYFRNPSLTNSRIYAIVITYDKSQVDKQSLKSFGNPENSKMQKYMFSSDGGSIKLTEDYLTNTAHMITTYIQTENGMKYYSKHTIASYNADIRNYDISLLSDYSIEEETNNVNDECFYVCTGISADATDNGVLEIYIPVTAIENSVKFYMNSTELTNSASNSWCVVSLVPNGSSKYERVTYNGRLMQKYKFNVSVKDNIPQITTGTDKTNTKDYNADPGVNNNADGCEVFQSILAGESLNTSNRYVTISVKYKNSLDFTGTEYKSVYKLEQSGYIEKRKIPKVNLNLLKDFESIESSNKLSNGVLCNQFQFFIDIDIEDFNSDIWGSYVEEDKITLNFDITSTPVDYEFVTRYGVTSSVDTYSIHSIVDSDSVGTDNYCRIYASLVDNSVNSIFDITQKELDDHSFINGNSNISNELLATGTSDYIDVQKKYPHIYYDTFSAPNKRNSGVTNITKVQFRDLKFSDVATGKFRVRVLVEFGNPLFSRLFFRYYVSDMYVMYNGKKFSVGTSNLAVSKHTGRVQSYEYMFATETLHAFICPVSLTATPGLKETDGSLVKTGSQLMFGSSEQIDIQISPFIPNEFIKMYSSYKSDSDIMSDMVNSQSIPWYEFDLKLKYLQDNVQNIKVSPIDVKETAEKVSEMPRLDSLIQKLSESVKYTKDYLSIVYNANAFNQQTIEDKKVFTYNDVNLESDRYSQYSKNAPMYLLQEVSYELRNSDLINSMNVWNYEYKLSGRSDLNAFMGHLNTYGNGYTLLDNEIDTGQFKNIYSLAETKEKNEERFFYFDDVARTTMPQLNNKNYCPKVGKWYRTLLYQARWQYPKYFTDDQHNEKIKPFDIVDAGTYVRGTREDVIPYNLTYSIYPRCAYDNDNDVLTVFMLRCPTIKQEMQYSLTKKDLLFVASDYDDMSGETEFNIL